MSVIDIGNMVGATVALGLLLLVNATGVLLVLFQLPGTWLIVGATGLCAWLLRDAGIFGWWTLGILVVLAIAGEIVETGSGAVGSRRAGGTPRGALLSIPAAIAGATLGASLAGSTALALVWALPLWLLVVLVGGAIGAAIGAAVGDRAEGRTWSDAGRSGFGAAVGRVGGTVGKVIVASMMWVVVAAAIFI